ncbi:sodium-dependent glucose transporter 1A-like [Glandiceps talaboti]
MALTNNDEEVKLTGQPRVAEDTSTNENIKVKERANEKEKRSIKITITVLIYLISFGVGYSVAVLGPCLLDFQLLLGTTLQKTTFIFIAKSSGFLIGCFVWGAGFDKFDNQFILGTCLLGAAITGVSVPWCNDFVSVIFAITGWGFFIGGMSTGSNIFCIKLWRKNSAPLLQGLFLCFAVGATVAPLIAGPFLTPAELARNSTSLQPSLSSENMTMNTRQQPGNQSEISNNYTADQLKYEGNGTLWVPFTVISIFFFIIAVLFSLLSMRNGCASANPQTRNSNLDNPTTAERETNIFTITLLVLLFSFVFFHIGHEIVYGAFIFTFAVESDFAFSINQASYLNSVFWGSYAASRGVGIFCATRLAPRTMLIIDLCGMCTASSLLAIFGGTVVEVLWGATILLGVSMATVFPSIILWADRYIKLTGKRIATFTMAASSSEIVLPLLFGFLTETFSIMMIMYMTLGLTVLTLISYIILQIIGSCHGERSRESEHETRSDNINCENDMALL